MEFVKTTLNGFVHGLRDSLAGFVLMFTYDTEVKKPVQITTQETNLAKRRAAQQLEKKQKQIAEDEDVRVTNRICQCCSLNGLVFGMSIVLFNFMVLPLLKFIINSLLGEGAGTVWSYALPTLTIIFESCWVVPLFLLSKIVNVIWFQDIADNAYKQRQGRPLLFGSIGKLIADVLISVVIQAMFLIQANLMRLLPLPGINVAVSCIHMCLLNSLYAFEYRWFNMGFELYKRLSFIEENWPYFLGFGLPLAFVSMIPTSFYLSGCLFAVLFPVFIISANEADPVVNTNGRSMQLFSMVVYVSNALFKFLVKTKTQETPSKPPRPTYLHSTNRPGRS